MQKYKKNPPGAGMEDFGEGFTAELSRLSGSQAFEGFENKEGRPYYCLKDSQYAYPESGSG
jgi:hypothetical protein